MTTATSTPTATPSLGSVLGSNCRALRMEAHLTQEELVELLRKLGLRWKRSNLTWFEAGERARPSLMELVLLSVALDRPVADLLSGSGEVALGAHGPAVELADLRGFLRGGSVPAQLTALLGTTADQPATSGPPRAERDMAHRLGVPITWILEAAQGLWGHTLTEERDLRVEAMSDTTDENRVARRASMTKQLEASVQKLVEKRALGL